MLVRGWSLEPYCAPTHPAEPGLGPGGRRHRAARRRAGPIAAGGRRRLRRPPGRFPGPPADGVGRDAARHPYLRRWDQRAAGRSGPKLSSGAVPIVENEWIPLERGVQGEFGLEGSYRTGEHWTVAARTLDGDVEWPEADGQRVLLPPFGPDEHLAALTWFQLSGEAQDLRMQFEPIAKPV
jgi:hypothetical protein